MANPLSDYGITDDELLKAIAESAEVDAGLNRFMTEEVVPYAKSVSPVDHGDFAAAWKVTKKARGGKGEVGNKNFKAHWIETGTGEPGPTKAYAPGQKTASHFGGNLDGGIEQGGEE